MYITTIFFCVFDVSHIGMIHMKQIILNCWSEIYKNRDTSAAKLLLSLGLYEYIYQDEYDEEDLIDVEIKTIDDMIVDFEDNNPNRQNITEAWNEAWLKLINNKDVETMQQLLDLGITTIGGEIPNCDEQKVFGNIELFEFYLANNLLHTFCVDEETYLSKEFWLNKQRSKMVCKAFVDNPEKLKEFKDDYGMYIDINVHTLLQCRSLDLLKQYKECDLITQYYGENDINNTDATSLLDHICRDMDLNAVEWCVENYPTKHNLSLLLTASGAKDINILRYLLDKDVVHTDDVHVNQAENLLGDFKINYRYIPDASKKMWMLIDKYGCKTLFGKTCADLLIDLIDKYSAQIYVELANSCVDAGLINRDDTKLMEHLYKYMDVDSYKKIINKMYRN